MTFFAFFYWLFMLIPKFFEAITGLFVIMYTGMVL